MRPSTFKSVLIGIAGLILSLYIPFSIEEKSEISLPEPVSDLDYQDEGKPDLKKVKLGQFLFFDKLISGNQNISCATCHHPNFATTDAVALPLGEGPDGLGPDRTGNGYGPSAVHERVPRNSPALFNLGAKEFTRMFHDGRVEIDSFGYYEGGFITPAKWKLPVGLENTLAAQALFPVSSPTEMAGQRGENSLAEAQALNNLAGKDGLWSRIAERLQQNDIYVDLFMEAFPNEVKVSQDITIVHAANAIAAFESFAFRADQSPFDQYLRERKGLTKQQLRGMKLFYGKADCASCHSGKFQTDHEFHAIAMPQIGPGKNDGFDPTYWRETGIKAFLEDFGRGRVTHDPSDSYKFRTPSLRNVELTAPYGHDGAYESLEAVIRHHLNPIKSLNEYKIPEDLLQPLNEVIELTANGPELIHHSMSEERKAAFLKRDYWVHSQPHLRQKIADANELTSISLKDKEIDDLISFLKSLTDSSSQNLDRFTPFAVPSGLLVERN